MGGLIVNPKTISKLDWTDRDSKKWLVDETRKICCKVNKENQREVPKLDQMEKTYKRLCKKVNAGISYVFSSPYIGGSLFDNSIIYYVNISNIKTNKVKLCFRACCLLELYCKTICILYAIYKKGKEKNGH